MNRFVQRQILSIVLLPGMVLVVIPAIIFWRTDQLNFAWGMSLHWNLLPILFALFFLAVGVVLMVMTISLFITIGKGTLAPWDPTQKLVIRGPYRYVRNSMISGVLAILLAEVILTGSTVMLIYFLIFAAVNMIYMPLSEEPGLLKRFGAEYATYKQQVPRWIPPITPWDGQDSKYTC